MPISKTDKEEKSSLKNTLAEAASLFVFFFPFLNRELFSPAKVLAMISVAVAGLIFSISGVFVSKK